MSLLVDWQIRQLAKEARLLEPFSEAVSGSGVISSGLTHAGYDLRLSPEGILLFREESWWEGVRNWLRGTPRTVDPKSFKDEAYRKDIFTEITPQKGAIVLPPRGYILGRSVEYIRMPRNLSGTCVGKSTLARSGILINTTPLEPGWCTTPDTEALTPQGWVSLADLRVGDDILTRSTNGVAEYRSVQRVVSRFFTGSLVHFDGRSVSQLVTPGHKVFTWGHKSPVPALIDASEVYGRWNYRFDRAVEWGGKDLSETFQIGEKSYPFHDFAEFYGCWLGDGSAYYGTDGGYHVKLAVVTKEEKRDHFRRLLNKLGIKHREHERGFAWYDKTLCLYLKQHGHAKDKFILQHWKNASPQCLTRLLAGLIASDGNRQTQTFTTSSHRLADDTQEIAFKSGASAIVRKTTSTIQGRDVVGYKVRICKTHLRPKMPPVNHRLVPYSGTVLCPTVTGGVWFCRHNGKASWTGNCGYLTIEISNICPIPAVVFPHQGIAQLRLEHLLSSPEKDYADKDGKYQGQIETTPARVL